MSYNRPEVGTWWKDKNTNTIYYCIGSSTYNGGIALEDTNSNMRLVHSLEYFNMNFEWLPQCHCFSWKPIPADQWPKFYVLVSGRSLFSYAKQSHQYCDSLCIEYDGTVSPAPFKDHDVQKWLSNGKWREVTIADANSRVRHAHRLTTTEMSDIMEGKPLPCPTVASAGYVFINSHTERYDGDQYWDYTTGVWAEPGTGIWATGKADYDRINDGPWQRKLSSIEQVPTKLWCDIATGTVICDVIRPGVAYTELKFKDAAQLNISVYYEKEKGT
jgi:hypothetical protein